MHANKRNENSSEPLEGIKRDSTVQRTGLRVIFQEGQGESSRALLLIPTSPIQIRKRIISSSAFSLFRDVPAWFFSVC